MGWVSGRHGREGEEREKGMEGMEAQTVYFTLQAATVHEWVCSVLLMEPLPSQGPIQIVCGEPHAMGCPWVPPTVQGQQC